MSTQSTGPDWNYFRVTSNKVRIACPNKIINLVFSFKRKISGYALPPGNNSRSLLVILQDALKFWSFCMHFRDLAVVLYLTQNASIAGDNTVKDTSIKNQGVRTVQ